MENKVYFYYGEYLTLKEIYEKYKKLEKEQQKPFRDCLAHFSLLEILKKCNYDERYIDIINDLAETEAAIINMYGSDCGTPILALRGMYRRNLRKLINLTGKIAYDNEDIRMNIFQNGEWLLNYIVCLTMGSSFEKDVVDDLVLIDYNSLLEDECQAVSDNFVRCLRSEEIVFYKAHQKIKK